MDLRGDLGTKKAKFAQRRLKQTDLVVMDYIVFEEAGHKLTCS
jgi:hypothetical protein